tara:strand:- start:791 stop:3445 length:2655 start_codon:yes stop_codon:yes gene_type:complete
MSNSDVTDAEQMNTLTGATGDSIKVEPQEVNFFQDIHSVGFSANQEHKSPSKFTGVGIHSSEPYMEWTNNSLHGETGLVNFQKIDSNWTTPLIDLTFPDGFTKNMTESELAKGFIGDGSINFTNTNLYSNIGWDSNTVSFNGPTTNDITTNTFNPSSPYAPAGDVTEWENPKTYYDSIHTINSISDTIFGPVDFFDGKSNHPDSIQGSTYAISGFDSNYNPGLFGGWSAEEPYGDSKLLTMWEQNESGKPIKTSFHTGYLGTSDNSTIEFPGPVGGFLFNQHEVSFPGGYSVEDTLGSSNLLGRSTNTHIVTGYGESDSFEGILTFNSTNLFIPNKIKIQSGVDDINPSKGSNKGGQESIQFKTLYTNENRATGNKYLGPPQDGSDINALDNFDIKSQLHQDGTRDMTIGGGAVLALSTAGLGNIPGFFGGNGNEPYIVRDIGKEDNPSSYFPLTTLMRDASRISKFLGSNKGVQFIINQELLGTFQQYRPYYDPASTILNSALPSEGLGVPMFNYPRDFGIIGSIIDLVNTANTYTEWLDTRVTGFDTTSIKDGFNINKTFAEREVARKPLAFQALDLLEVAATDLVNSVVDGLIPGAGSGGSVTDVAGIDKKSKIDSVNNVNTSISPKTANTGTSPYKGDFMTLMQFGDKETDTKHKGPLSEAHPSDSTKVESSQNGMPFYFQDLRDNAYVFFRAYIGGLSDTVSPSWSSTNYIGRSEPVYTYTNSEREVAFNLQLFANTKDELNMIYVKINKLTSMVYPEYKKAESVQFEGIDSPIEVGSIGGKLRMKPPLTKFRLGELFGSSNNEMTGFIKSLSYTFPDESPWEIKSGHRVPKHVTVDITYQVIHSSVPSLDFARTIDAGGTPTENKTFYGINNTLGVEP